MSLRLRYNSIVGITIVIRETKKRISIATSTISSVHCVVADDIIPAVLVQTLNEKVEELDETLNGFFSTSMGDLITEERFNDCKEGWLFKKKKIEILPHAGVLSTVVADYNPFNGLEDVSREDVLEFGDEFFSIGNFEMIMV